MDSDVQEMRRPRLDSGDRSDARVQTPSIPGVSLLELIITIGLLAVLGLGLFGFHSHGVSAGLHAQGLAVASALAQERLELVRSDTFSGVNLTLNRRAARIAGYEEELQVGEEAIGLQQVTVTVFWIWRGHERQITLTAVVPDEDH